MTNNTKRALPGVIAIAVGVGVLVLVAAQVFGWISDSDSTGVSSDADATTSTVLSGEPEEVGDDTAADTTLSVEAGDVAGTDAGDATDTSSGTAEPETVVLSTGAVNQTELARTGAGDLLFILTAVGLAMCAVGLWAVEKQRRMV